MKFHVVCTYDEELRGRRPRAFRRETLAKTVTPIRPIPGVLLVMEKRGQPISFNALNKLQG